MLLNLPAESFPTIPSLAAAANLYGSISQTHSGGYPFAVYSVSVSEAGATPTADAISADVASVLCNTSAWTQDFVPAVTAGPMMTCAAGACSGPPTGGTGSQHCRASFNQASLQLNSGRAGTHWAPALSTPAWAQFIFPAIPAGTTRLTMRYALDARYRPELYGGNPCANATSTYNCTICKFEGECRWNGAAGAFRCPGDDSWDYSQRPGFYALWSAAGRSEYVVSGPHDVTNDGLFDAGVNTRTLDAPASLAIQPGEYPTVTFFTYSQYSAFGEAVRDSHSMRCSISDSDQSGHQLKNHPLMIASVTILYRQVCDLPRSPPCHHLLTPSHTFSLAHMFSRLLTPPPSLSSHTFSHLLTPSHTFSLAHTFSHLLTSPPSLSSLVRGSACPRSRRRRDRASTARTRHGTLHACAPSSTPRATPRPRAQAAGSSSRE